MVLLFLTLTFSTNFFASSIVFVTIICKRTFYDNSRYCLQNLGLIHATLFFSDLLIIKSIFIRINWFLIFSSDDFNVSIISRMYWCGKMVPVVTYFNHKEIVIDNVVFIFISLAYLMCVHFSFKVFCFRSLLLHSCHISGV